MSGNRLPIDRHVTNAVGSFLKIDGIDPKRHQSLAVKSVRLSLTEADNDYRGCPLAHNDERRPKGRMHFALYR